MKKDILLLVTGEENWGFRFHNAETMLEQSVKIIRGEDTILKSFQKCAQIAATELFVLIDGDNLVHENAKEQLENCNVPTVFFSTNKYNIKYGHGGIKVLSKFAKLNLVSPIDISAKLGLEVNPTVISYHDFAFSEFNEWKTIFKELLKLFLWGNKATLRLWLEHEYPNTIFKKDVVAFLKTASLESIEKTITNVSRLKLLYEKSSNRSNM